MHAFDYVDGAIEQFWKRLSLIIAVKRGNAEHLHTVFNIAALHCNDRRQSFPKLFDCSVYVKHSIMFHFFMRHPVQTSIFLL